MWLLFSTRWQSKSVSRWTVAAGRCGFIEQAFPEFQADRREEPKLVFSSLSSFLGLSYPLEYGMPVAALCSLVVDDEALIGYIEPME